MMVQLVKKHVVIWMALVCVFGTQAVTLDFGSLKNQIEGPIGASVCQFSSDRFEPQEWPWDVTYYIYNSLQGFPEDKSGNAFSRFMDVCFSTEGEKGMGLSQLWATPSPKQTPPNSIGKTYDVASWTNLDFRMYEPDMVMDASTNYLIRDDGKSSARGFTVPFYVGAAKRAREQNKRILFWVDYHFTYPSWFWDEKASRPLLQSKWEEAALHNVYFCKYLVSKYGIPLHSISFMNEPEAGPRHSFNEETVLRFSKVLRAKLDEAGLQGIRIIGTTRLYLENVTKIMDQMNAMPEFKPYVDYLAGHVFHEQGPVERTYPNTPVWITSGVFNGLYSGHGSFRMGGNDKVDEYMRVHTNRYFKNTGLTGNWHLRRIVGLDGATEVPSNYDPSKDGQYRMVDVAATVFPFLRPGMSVVEGSMGSSPESALSVDGFAGRGHNPCIVISNGSSSQNVTINLKGIDAASFDVYQCDALNSRRRLDPLNVSSSSVSLQVPANSVTCLVANKSNTKPRVYVVVKNRGSLTADDNGIIEALTASMADALVVSQDFPQTEQDLHQTKRLPVDPMGAACYVISSSVDKAAVVRAHDVAKAPVVAVGAFAAQYLKIDIGKRYKGGDPLARRDELDPPASILDNGLPLSCNSRVALAAFERNRLLDEVAWAVSTAGGIDARLDHNTSATSAPRHIAHSTLTGIVLSDGGRTVSITAPRETATLTLSVLSTQGRTLRSMRMGPLAEGEGKTVGLGELAPGAYIVVVNYGSGVITRPFAVRRQE